MVYCGKPSKGCSSCRGRKIRCDQKEPGCGQCEKRQQECPGYRNLVDLMFRDESSHVIKKAAKTKARDHGKNLQALGGSTRTPESGLVAPASNGTEISTTVPRKKARPVARRQTNPSRALTVTTQNVSIRSRQQHNSWPSPPEPDSSQDEDVDDHDDDVDDDEDEDDRSILPSPDEGDWPATLQPTLLYSLSPSYQERGTAYFFSRYVSVDENACHQNYDFIFDVWRPASMLPGRQVDGVMASMTAVGLAGLAALTKSLRTMDWARRSYGTALNLTNSALRDASEAIKDTTMLSILILGTYEMLTGRSPQTVRAWQQHINGASALAKMRGLGQFRSRAGVRMFMMLTQTVIINCIQRNLPMPPPLVELRNQLAMFSAPGDPNWRMSGPIYKVMQLRHDIKCGKLGQADLIVNELTKVDQEFVDIIADLPETWKYRTVSLSESHSGVFDGYNCHIFPALTLAATWNGVRSIRMLVHETIIAELFKSFRGNQILSWPYEAQLQLASSVGLLNRLRDAILASVPQHFGVVSFKDTQPDSDGLPVAIVTAKRPPQRIVPSHVTRSSSSPESSSANSSPRPTAFNGPTLYDPTQAEGLHDGAERFMVLASASNTIVWPLYLLGVSSSCTPQVRKYVIERLQAIHEEHGLVQAGGVADMVRNKEISVPWADLPWGQMPQTQTAAGTLL